MEVIWNPTEDQKMMLDRMAVTGGDFSHSDYKEDDIEAVCRDYLNLLNKEANGDPDKLAEMQQIREWFIRKGWLPKTEGNDE